MFTKKVYLVPWLFAEPRGGNALLEGPIDGFVQGSLAARLLIGGASPNVRLNVLSAGRRCWSCGSDWGMTQLRSTTLAALALNIM